MLGGRPRDTAAVFAATGVTRFQTVAEVPGVARQACSSHGPRLTDRQPLVPAAGSRMFSDDLGA
jgi:hypothetical protein